MKICKNCKIKTLNNFDICPLCKSKLFYDNNNNNNDNPNNQNLNNTYPIIEINTSKYSIVFKILTLISLIVSTICLILNFFITKSILWSILCILVIVYCWITTLASIKKRFNIAAHLLIQTICISISAIIIDIILGYKGWSLNIIVPLIIIIANIFIFILFLVNHKKPNKYIISQFVISLLSLTPLILYLFNLSNSLFLTIISTLVAFFTFISTVLLYTKSVKEEIEKTFHF